MGGVDKDNFGGMIFAYAIRVCSSRLGRDSWPFSSKGNYKFIKTRCERENRGLPEMGSNPKQKETITNTSYGWKLHVKHNSIIPNAALSWSIVPNAHI